MNYTREQLNKMSKSTLARIHEQRGALMGYSTYMKWAKEELVNEILSGQEAANRG